MACFLVPTTEAIVTTIVKKTTDKSADKKKIEIKNPFIKRLRGGTIPLLQQWLASGMSMGSAAAFMVTGPATKITNLGALKIVLGIKHFAMYIAFVMLYALVSGFIVNLL